MEFSSMCKELLTKIKNTMLLCVFCMSVVGCGEGDNALDECGETTMNETLTAVEKMTHMESTDDSAKEEPFYQYYLEDGSLQMELYYDVEIGKGHGVRYYPGENEREAEEFTFQDVIEPEAIVGVEEISLCLDTYNICGDRDGYTGEDEAQNYREEKEYTQDGRLDSYCSTGWIDWVDEKETDSDIIKIDWKYREDGTLQERKFFRNHFMFGTWFSSQKHYYNKNEQLAYSNLYITHGDVDVYYIYGEDERVPEYYFYIDHNLNVLDTGLVRYEEPVDEDAVDYPVLITPELTNNIDYAFINENRICLYNGELYGYIDMDGKAITGMVYDMAYPFSEGLACAMIDGIYGFLDRNGEVAIPFNYLDAAPFSEGLAYFYGDEGYGFLNTDGSVAFTLDCDSVSSFQEGLAYFTVDGKYGYLDKNGEVAIEPVFHDADYFENGLAIVRKEGFFGVINKKGEDVIPIVYDDIYRGWNGYQAQTGEQYDFYALDGTQISKEDYQAYEPRTESAFTVTEEDGNVTVTDSAGNEVLSADCWYDSHNIYGDYRNYVLCQFDEDKKDQILLVEDSKADFSDVLLRNSITPRRSEYWKLTHGKYVDLVKYEAENLQKYNVWTEYDYIKKFALYDVNASGQPILYAVEEPCLSAGFPMSDSAFYAIKDNKLHLLIAANECGGSARGNYACFYRNVETGEVYLGARGGAGGFGGFSDYGDIFQYQNAALQRVCAFTQIAWFSSPCYEEDEMLRDAHLFYVEEVPCTTENILSAEGLSEYLLGDKRVTVEEYRSTVAQFEKVMVLR